MKINDLIPSEGNVKASLAIKMAVVVTSGQDDTVTPSELAAAVTEASVRVSIDNKTGVIRQRTPHCMGTVGFKSSAAAAKGSRHIIG